MLFGRPTAHVRADFGDQLQRGLRADGINLTQVSAAGQPMQRSADVETRLVAFGVALTARRWQRGGGLRLLCGEGVEERFDGGVTLGNLRKVELVGRKVLPQ